MNIENVIAETGIEKVTGDNIRLKFIPFLERVKEWKEKANSLVVTDVTQVREMKMAREGRLALRDIRLEADRVRKALKEDSNRYGKAVQNVYNLILDNITPLEDHLKAQEEFKERIEAAQRRERALVREIELSPYAEFVAVNIDLENMPEDDYQKILRGAELQLKAREEEIAKREEERLAAIKAEEEENERVRVENERLKAEAIAKEESLAEERRLAEVLLAEERAAKLKQQQEAEAKLEEERAANRKLQAELKAKQDEEDKIKREEEAKRVAEQKAQKKLANAPDKAKLLLLADDIMKVTAFVEVKSDDAKKVLVAIKGLLDKTAIYAKEKAEEL